MNDPVNEITSMWRGLKYISNIWQGDGRTNCISPLFPMNRLKQVIFARENHPQISKVYHWTIDLTTSLRASLRAGVDAIITNHPERLVKVLKEPAFSSRLKMADKWDNPWVKVKQVEDLLPVSDSGSFFSDLDDKRDSIHKFIKEFIGLRTSHD